MQGLLGLDFPEFSAWCRELVGHDGRFHRALYRQVMETGCIDAAILPVWQEAERSRPGTIATIAAAVDNDQLPVVIDAATAEDPEQGTTTKLLLRLADGREIETVHIPMKGGSYHTVCVSSQVGCRMGCRFCRTATMGLVRNLAAHEIVGQVVAAARHTGLMPRNVVFMGMGEPLDNIEAVAQAVRVLTDANGLGLAFERITLSTVGRADVIPTLPFFGLHRVSLAVSLTAADDTLRSKLIPINRVHNLAALKAALMALPLPRDRRILVSYVVIAGLNDTAEHAERLAEWCRDLPVMVNLIPFNPIPGVGFCRPDTIEINIFRAHLVRLRVPVRMRTTRGDDMLAACGQLATEAATSETPPV